MQGQKYGREVSILGTTDTSKHEEPSTLSIYHYYLPLVPQDLEHTQITPRRLRVKWRKSESPEQLSYEVTATGPRHTVITCSAKNGQAEHASASCEGLSPCTTYNVSVRECDRESGCGEAAVKSFSTMPDSRFTFSELPS